jgi:hypothetical protein
MKTLGIVLIVIGIAMMVITGINVVTKEKVVDVGPLEINKTERTPINWSPIIGVILLVSGIAVTATDKRRGI